MDANLLHRSVIESYKNYLISFINISDKRINDSVLASFENKGFLPDPLIQFNPSFKKDESLEDLERS